MNSMTTVSNAVQTPVEMGPTGLLAGRRSTPADTQEEARMSSTIESIGVAVAAAHSRSLKAVEQFRASDLSADQLAAAVAEAHALTDAVVAAVPTPACPSWCDRRPGHPYETLDEVDGQAVATRCHSKTFHETPEFELFVEAEERVEWPGTVLGKPVMSAIGELSHLSVQEARAVAQAIHGAANLLTTIGGAR